MIKKIRLYIFLLILILSLAAGVYLAYVYQSHLSQEIMQIEQIDYQEERSLSVKRTNGEEEVRELSSNFPSPPKISPDARRLAFIAPWQWEEIGDIYIYNYPEDNLSTLLEGADFASQHTPKNVWWFDDDYLLVLEGYAYGTVSVGGELKIVEVNSGEKVSLVAFPEEDRKEIMDIEYIEEEELYILEIAQFDEEFLEYEVITADLEVDYIKTVIADEF